MNAEAPFEVVYLDNHLLVIVKPHGLLAQADRTGDPDVLTLGKAYLKSRFNRPGNVFLGLVHRLDRPVSGLMVLARTSKSAARLSAQFRERSVEKGYLAIIEGILDAPVVLRDTLLKQDEKVRVVPASTKGGKTAELSVTPVSSHDGQTLVEVRLGTGRAHQIRVQLAARGLPILGDNRYGATQPFARGGIALHSYRLAVEHPTQRIPLVWHAAPQRWPSPFASLAQERTRRSGAGAQA